MKNLIISSKYSEPDAELQIKLKKNMIEFIDFW